MAPQAVALLTNFVPPYLVSLYGALARRVGRLRILVSTEMEANRPWSFQGAGLPVEVQRTLTWRQRWRHPNGFTEVAYLHLPLDTLARLLRSRPAVVVTTEFGFRTLQALLYRALRPEVRIVVWALVSETTEHGRARWRESLRRWILRRSHAVIVSGESGARYVARLGFPDEAIFRVPPYATPAEPGDAPCARAPEADHRLLYVGQLVERKGLHEFVWALSEWAQSNPERRLELEIVGDGPCRADLERRELPPNLELRLRGAVAYDALASCYASAGILVFPTLADEWGVVVNEALAAGLPVLGSRYSQAVEALVDEGETGWSFRPDHPAEVAAALERALSTDAGTLGRMREHCRERAGRFAPDAVADRLLEAIEYASARLRGA